MRRDEETKESKSSKIMQVIAREQERAAEGKKEKMIQETKRSRRMKEKVRER